MISLRHALFRAISSSSTGFVARPRTFTSLAKPALRLNQRVPAYAFQRRLFSDENRPEAPASANQGEESVVQTSINAADRDVARDPRQHPFQPNETVYVGNLFFDVTADNLKGHMSQFGNVETVRVIYDSRGLSRGFAYVKFDSVEGAQKAVDNMHLTVYEGRRVVVSWAKHNNTNLSDRPRSTLKQPTKTLFIGNISWDMTDAELNELFKDIKNVIDVRVSMDRRTGRPRGFAHADFLDVESAQEAYNILKEKTPYGRPLRVDYSFGTKSTNEPRPPQEPASEGQPAPEKQE